MDLVSRLRRYIGHIAMPVTQFADTCGIPRPTMSQLLSGRNKKVSNELIAKIHEAFPSLNVLWLMFGQGDMTLNENIAATKPQNSPVENYSESQPSDCRQIGDMVIHFDEDDSPGQKKSQPADGAVSDEDEATDTPVAAESCVNDEAQMPYGYPRSSVSRLGRSATGDGSGNAKRIVNIIVYYSDNSFEAFIPERQ